MSVLRTREIKDRMGKRKRKESQSLKLNFTFLSVVGLELDVIPKMKTKQYASPFPDTARRQ